MSFTADFIDGPDDPSSCAISGLPVTLCFPAFAGRSALIRTERVYKRVGDLRDGQATYRFDRERIVHGG